MICKVHLQEISGHVLLRSVIWSSSIFLKIIGGINKISRISDLVWYTIAVGASLFAGVPQVRPAPSPSDNPIPFLCLLFFLLPALWSLSDLFCFLLPALWCLPDLLLCLLIPDLSAAMLLVSTLLNVPSLAYYVPHTCYGLAIPELCAMLTIYGSSWVMHTYHKSQKHNCSGLHPASNLLWGKCLGSQPHAPDLGQAARLGAAGFEAA